MNIVEAKSRKDGYNVKRLREILGVKQEELAEKLNVSQQTISKIEQKEVLEDNLLESIAKALNVSVDAIKGFSDEATFNIVANTFESYSSAVNYYPSFNPIDRVVELYERMLAAEKEKVALLEEMLKRK